MDDNGTFKAGDVCLDCQQIGIVKYLRYFKINLNGDTLLKCESNECMYPYNDEFSETDDEDNYDVSNSLIETNSIKFIDDLLQQIKNETAEQNDIINCANENSNKISADVASKSSEEDSKLEINFFNTFDEIVNENFSKSHNIKNEAIKYPIDNNTNIYSLTSLPMVDEDVTEQISLEPYDNDKKEQLFSLPTSFDTETQHKTKIDIQSVETIKPSHISENCLSSLTKIQTNVSTCENLKTTPTEGNDSSIENPKPLAKTKSRRKPNVSVSKPNVSKDSHKSSAKLPKKITAPSTETKTIGIPQANIMKGSDFLQKLALIDEKTPKYNIKCKEARKKASNIPKENDTNLSHGEGTKDMELKTEKEEINFSLEAIAELLNASKKRNANKRN